MRTHALLPGGGLGAASSRLPPTRAQHPPPTRAPAAPTESCLEGYQSLSGRGGPAHTSTGGQRVAAGPVSWKLWRQGGKGCPQSARRAAIGSHPARAHLPSSGQLHAIILHQVRHHFLVTVESVEPHEQLPVLRARRGVGRRRARRAVPRHGLAGRGQPRGAVGVLEGCAEPLLRLMPTLALAARRPWASGAGALPG